MKILIKKLKTVLITIAILTIGFTTFSQKNPDFKVIAYYTAKIDKGHISSVNETNSWFFEMGKKNHFTYFSTNDWSNLSSGFISEFDVVIFLDSRPDVLSQREAFQQYMENGGAWMGFHFCAFALTPSAFPQNWNWYHNTFLGSGEYKSNTWRPTSAILKAEDRTHPATKQLPEIFTTSPNEWYRWENDLRKNPDIKILASIDSTSFLLGNGPKQNEIWHSVYYPVVWTNTNYQMININMGHNDIDYENGTNAELSSTFKKNIEQQPILIKQLTLHANPDISEIE